MRAESIVEKLPTSVSPGFVFRPFGTSVVRTSKADSCGRHAALPSGYSSKPPSLSSGSRFAKHIAYHWLARLVFETPSRLFCHHQVSPVLLLCRASLGHANLRVPKNVVLVGVGSGDIAERAQGERAQFTRALEPGQGRFSLGRRKDSGHQVRCRRAPVVKK